MPQAAGNAVISCIFAAHTKYKLNPADWRQVVEIGWHLLTKQDIERFEEMCKDGLLGLGDHGLFEDWSDINRSRDGYIHIRDGLVLVREVQEMNDEENFYNNGPYQAHVHGFFLGYHQVVAYHWWLLFHQTDLGRYREFKMSLERVMFIALLLVSFYLLDGDFSFGMRIRQA